MDCIKLLGGPVISRLLLASQAGDNRFSPACEAADILANVGYRWNKNGNDD